MSDTVASFDALSLAITTHIPADGDVIFDYMTERGLSTDDAHHLLMFMLNDPGVTATFDYGLIRYTVSYVNPETSADYYDVSMNNLVA